MEELELERFKDSIRIRGKATRCARCGIILTGRPISVVKSSRGWVCQELGPCLWRRRRAFDARQTTFNW